MRREYYSWIVISIIVCILAIAGLLISVSKQKQLPISSSTSSPSADESPTASSSLSPSEPPSPLPTVISSPLTAADYKQNGKIAYQKGDYLTAIAQYKLAIDATPTGKLQAELWNLLGNSFRDNKSLTAALDSYAKAYTLDPQLINAYINASNVYLSQNKNDDAKKVLELGLEKNPHNADLERELSIANLSGTEGN